MAAQNSESGIARQDGGTALRWMCAFALVLALWLHIVVWPTATPDMGICLLPWYGHIVEHGPVGAFSRPFSNYTPPYLYLLAIASLFDGWVSAFTLIKLVSVAGTGALAAAAYALLGAAGAPHRREFALLVFAIPSTIANAPFIGQCDAFWVAACLMGVAEAIRGRHARMLLWAGLAFAFKAQAAFIAPFVLGILVARRVPLQLWLIPPAVYGAAILPACLAGWPLRELLMVYPLQAGFFDTPGNLSNPWVIARMLAPEEAKSFYWLGYAAALGAGAGVVALLARRAWSPNQLIALALLSALALPWFLPKMHERYFLLADLLAFCLAAASRDRRAVDIAIAVQLASVTAYFSYWTNWHVAAGAGALVAGLALPATYRWLVTQSRREAGPTAFAAPLARSAPAG
jgi:Gpi18-like mannosyltransferase